MAAYTNLCFDPWETTIQLQFNSHVTLATVSYLRATLRSGVSSSQEKPHEHSCVLPSGEPPQCCSLSLQGGRADLQPGPHVAWATERYVDPIVTMLFSKVQSADGELSLAVPKAVLKSPMWLAYKKSIGVLTYKVHCTVNFIFYTGGQEIVRSDII